VTSNFQVYFTTWLIDAEKVKKQKNVNSAYRKKLRQQHFTFRLTPRFKSHQSLFLSCHKTLLLTFTLIWTSACYLSSQKVHSSHRRIAHHAISQAARQGAPSRQCSMVFKNPMRTQRTQNYLSTGMDHKRMCDWFVEVCRLGAR
jgi:hypothetical protein